jgi:hypothetical protein
MSVNPEPGPGRPASRPTAGIDWASEEHAVSVVGPQGVELERFTVEHTAAGLRRGCGVCRVASSASAWPRWGSSGRTARWSMPCWAPA